MQDTIAEKISMVHFVVFAAMLPFNRLYSELALVSLLIHTLIHLDRKQLKNICRTDFLLSTAGIYLLTCIWTIGSTHLQQAFFEWEIQLALLLFPFILTVNPIPLKNYSDTIILVMGISCTVAIVYLYGEAFRVILFYHLPFSSLYTDAFINHNFSLPLDLHATYFSLYIALSLMAFLYQQLYAGKTRFRKLRICCIPVLVAGLVQLSSKSVLIAVCVLLLFVLPLQLPLRKRILFLAVSLCLCGCAVILVSANKDLRNRYFRDLVSDLSVTNQNPQQLAPRALRWKTGWELIQTAPFLGHGSGAEIAELKQLYFKHHLYNAYINELNVHNQYLSFLIKTGIPGLLLYLLVLTRTYRLAVRRKDLVFLSFLVLITITGLSENILDVNKGIFFVAFFFSLFYFSNKEPFIVGKDQAWFQK